MTEPALSSSPTSSPRALAPTLLSANTPGERPYRGGEGIAKFRGEPLPDEWRPEDFVGSTTEVFSGGGVGLSRLPGGELLRDAVERDPAGWLGEDHVRRWGSDTRLLVKLLDTRERLFVHYHPDSDFAATYLHRRSGKTEAWIITAVDGDGAVWLGFQRDVSPHEVAEWFEQQNSAAMLEAMNRIAVAPGDTIFVPASTPHAIGTGITLVELQQPTDLSLILEWKAYRGLDGEAALMGLEIGAAIEALDCSTLSPEHLAELRAVRLDGEIVHPFPVEADDFFRADVIDVTESLVLDACFSVVVILSGTGSLHYRESNLDVAAGETVLLPYGAGDVTLTGAMRVIRARPPAP